jgi:hypothetical protein
MRIFAYKSKQMKSHHFTIIGIVLVLVFYYCAFGNNKENAQQILEKKGFTSIELGGWFYSRCYTNTVEFTAIYNGQTVKGYVGYIFNAKNADIVITK